MANMVALNMGAIDQRVVFAPRPRTAPHKPRRASGHSAPAAGRFQTQRASPGLGEKWPLGALEGRVRGHGPRQITPRIKQVCGRTGEEVGSRRFLRAYSGHAPPPAGGHTPRRTASRCAPGHKPMPLGEIQRLLKNKVAGRSLAPMFRSFDPRGKGRVWKWDFRRVLECCLFLLSDQEFERLWDHYSPDSAYDMAYADFLRKLEGGSPQTLDLGPVCTKMELSSPRVATPDPVQPKTGSRDPQDHPPDRQDPPDPTRALTNTQLQTRFHQEMCLNCVPVWKTLHAADATRSGLVEQEVLRKVLCNFLFPMSLPSFKQLTRGYGVKGNGPVKWKHFLGHFLGHFLDPAERTDGRTDGRPPSANGWTDGRPPSANGWTDGRAPSADGSLHQLHHKEIPPDLEEEVYPRLKELFLLLDPSGSGGVPRAELRWALEGPYPHPFRGRPPDRPAHRPPRRRLSHARVNRLLNLLDPEHTGLVERARLETLRPNEGSPPGGSGPPSPPCPGGPAHDLGERGERQGQDPGGGLGSGLAALRLSMWATPHDDLMRTHSAGSLSHTHPDQRSPCPDLTVEDHFGADLTGADPTGADLTVQDLTGQDPTRQDLTGSDHSWPDLTVQDLTRQDLTVQDLTRQDLTVQDLTRQDLTRQDLTRQDLTGQDLTRQDLTGQDLTATDLTVQDLTATDLTGQDLTGQDLTATDLTVQDLTATDLTGPDHGSQGQGSPDHGSPDHSSLDHGGPAPSPLQSSSLPTGGAVVPGLLEVVFRRVRERMEQCGATLAARIQAIALPSLDGTLSQRDLRKVLEDSWVVLEDAHFLHVTRLLGFRHGRLDRSTLLDRYQEFSFGAVKQNGHGHHGDGHNKPHFLSAEECLAFMRAKMADDCADSVPAFRMRTADGDGMADAADLRDAVRSLGLVASEPEFQRLLRLIGLQPGAKIPYSHLRHALMTGGARGRSLGTMNVLDQIQEQLASDLRYKRAFMLQALRGPEEEGRDLVSKMSLRNQLFTYDLPLRPAEFEQLWLRFDPKGRGCVTLVDFLNQLGVKHDGKSSASVPPGSAEKAGRGRDPDMPSEAAELLETKVPLDTGHRKSAYQDFLSASQPQEEEERRSPPQPAHRVETLHGLAPDRALSRLRELVRDSAPVLHKAFSTFDPGRTGRVSGVELRRALESVCARQSDGQYRHMLGELGLNREQQTVDWKVFLARLQSPRQLATPETSSQPITDVLARIQEVVSGHLFDVTKAMVVLDHYGTNSISREDFERVCGRYVRLSPRQFASVWPELPLSASGRLRCGEFLRRFGVAPPVGPARVPACTSPAPGERAASTVSNSRRRPEIAIATPPQRPQSAPEVPSRLWSTAGGSRRGSPPDDRKCRDSTGSASHKDLVRQFLLKLQPPVGNQAFQRNRLPPPTKTTGRPAVLTAQCVEVLLRVDRAVRLSWRSIRQAFATYDPGRTGRISTQAFRKVLQCFSVRLTEEDFFHISSYFDAGALGTINYNDFLRAYLH